MPAWFKCIQSSALCASYIACPIPNLKREESIHVWKSQLALHPHTEDNNKRSGFVCKRGVSSSSSERLVCVSTSECKSALPAESKIGRIRGKTGRIQGSWANMRKDISASMGDLFPKLLRGSCKPEHVSRQFILSVDALNFGCFRWWRWFGVVHHWLGNGCCGVLSSDCPCH